jgi:hypothetical protein
MEEDIQVGYQVFISDGGEEVGAVREIPPDRRRIVIYIENSGDFDVDAEAIESVHSQKVILNCDKLPPALRRAIGHAHDAETPDA